MRDVLIVCPQERDFRVIEASGLASRYGVRFAGEDLDRFDDFDADAVVAEAEGVPADGVVGTKDRSALLASIVAGRRGLRSPSVEAMLACQHKLTARAIEQQLVPEATPRYALLDGRPPGFPPPWFVKPVVGRLSQRARRVDGPEELAAAPVSDRYRAGYAQIARLAGLQPNVSGLLVEELLAGDEVTLEGFARDGSATVVGVTDSIKYAGTNSFQRFQYPSALAPERLAELADVSSRLLPALGFDDGFFNVEFIVPDRGPAKIVEVNGRIASQFEPLVRACHGRSTYDALFAIACGEDPGWEPGPADGVAASYVVRVFEDALVEAVPEPEEGLEVLVHPGRRLSEQGPNDAASYRLAIFYEHGESEEEVLARCRERAARLRFELR